MKEPLTQERLEEIRNEASYYLSRQANVLIEELLDEVTRLRRLLADLLADLKDVAGEEYYRRLEEALGKGDNAWLTK